MKTYNLKLTALSPIHIGTGEEYEPINYVIDKQKIKQADGKIVEFNYMFVFDEMSFYKALDSQKQQEFNKIVSDTSSEATFKLYRFIVLNKEIAKKISYNKVRVLKSFADDYYANIGRVVQKETGGIKVFNKYIIAKTYLSPNTSKPLLLGSSLKGSISTAFQEKLYKQSRDYIAVEEQMLKPTENNLFRNFLISDANMLKGSTFIDEAINKKRNKETTQEDSGVKIRIQAIAQTSEFETKISIKNEKIKLEDIINSCNNHYLPIFKSHFDFQTDEFTRKYLNDNFVKNYENFKLKPNQFLLRVGKHSSARAVTVDGIRDIKIMQGKGKYRNGKEETTFWSINKYPFGWLLCEIVD